MHVAYDSKVLLRYKVVKSSERGFGGAQLTQEGGCGAWKRTRSGRKEDEVCRAESESSRSRNSTVTGLVGSLDFYT